MEEYDTDPRGFSKVLELLARSKRLYGDLRQAEELGQQALELAKEVGDREGPDVFSAMSSPAITKEWMGKLEEAERMVSEETRGENNPYTLAAMANLAATKRERGWLGAAEKLEQQVLQMRRKTMDESDPEVLSAMANLALTRGKLGKLKEKEQIEERVLELRKKLR